MSTFIQMLSDCCNMIMFAFIYLQILGFLSFITVGCGAALAELLFYFCGIVFWNGTDLCIEFIENFWTKCSLRLIANQT